MSSDHVQSLLLHATQVLESSATLIAKNWSIQLTIRLLVAIVCHL